MRKSSRPISGSRKRTEAVDALAKEEEIAPAVFNHYLSEYEYVQKEQTDIIKDALKKKHPGLIKRSRTLKRIVERLRSIIRIFNWNRQNCTVLNYPAYA